MANWQHQSPHAWAKLNPGILKWMRTTEHPHKKCTRALMKKGIPREQAVKMCAVAKDMAFKSTDWRNK